MLKAPVAIHGDFEAMNKDVDPNAVDNQIK